MVERRPATEVLMGHRVGPPVAEGTLGPDAANTVTAEELDRLLAVRAGLACRAAELTDAPRASRFVLTFDDGYRDNLTEALPVLERHGVPAVIFVTSGFVSGEAFPTEVQLARLLASLSRLRLPDGGELACEGAADRLAAYDTLRAKLKRAGASGRARLLERIAAANGIELPGPDDRFLDWDGVRELDRHPLVTIGAHTRSHPLLTRTSGDEAWREIAGGKADLEERLGHPVALFAYPYGGHDFRVRRLVARAGFAMAFTTEPTPFQGGAARRRWRIPRIDVRRALERTAA